MIGYPIIAPQINPKITMQYFFVFEYLIINDIIYYLLNYYFGTNFMNIKQGIIKGITIKKNIKIAKMHINIPKSNKKGLANIIPNDFNFEGLV